MPGDTNSTLAGALTATKLHIPVAHIEAEARSYDIKMPEEINRHLTDHCSTLLFTPTENLIKEGINKNKIHQTGDTMYDVLLQQLPKAEKTTILKKPKTRNLCTTNNPQTRKRRQPKKPKKHHRSNNKTETISHGSVDQCRVAFGFGKPIICTLDTPYAEAVHRLTLPLSDYVIASKAISIKDLRAYHVKGEVIRFDGVDEVAWIKGSKPKVVYDFGKPLIVVRQLEEKAVYTKESVDMVALAKNLTRLGNVIFLSRYHRRDIRGLIVPKEFVDSASLVAQADLFVGAGGTIAREAALQGTPAIIVDVFQKQYVNDFLAKKGFPIFKTKFSNVLKLAEKLLGKKRNVKHLLAELENPLDIIIGIIEKLSI